MNKSNHLISRHDNKLKQWADLRDTSIEIAQAIFLRAEGDFSIAERIFEEPTLEEISDITELSFKIQDLDFPDPELQDICLYWGEKKVWREGY